MVVPWHQHHKYKETKKIVIFIIHLHSVKNWLITVAVDDGDDDDDDDDDDDTNKL